MSHKVKIDLPEANLDKRDTEAPKVPPINISVEDNGNLYWNDEPVTKDLLESRLSIEAQKTPQPQVNVRGDKTTKYRVVSDVVRIAQTQGMRKVGFMALKEPR
jgi:biopolymer transport protein ExbD